jgi:hypothetical protein
MTWAFGVYYKPPANPAKEEALTKRVQTLGGRLDFREEPVGAGVCITYEFDDVQKADHAAGLLREQGEHVEGPYQYASGS